MLKCQQFEYQQSIFWCKNKKKCIPLYTSFSYINVGFEKDYISQTCYPDELTAICQSALILFGNEKLYLIRKIALVQDVAVLITLCNRGLLYM